MTSAPHHVYHHPPFSAKDADVLSRAVADAMHDAELILNPSMTPPQDTDKTLATNVRVIVSILRDYGVTA